MDGRLVRISKFLAKVLRHDPASIGLKLDDAGWASIQDLLDRAAAAGFAFTRTQLDGVVAENDKRRYAINAEGTHIRANQGHSVTVELGLPAATPPARLYHGTSVSALERIRREGLRPMARHDVHLSTDPDTARRVGARYGKPVVLLIDAKSMTAAGHEFRRTGNGVWLTHHVPARYLEVYR